MYEHGFKNNLRGLPGSLGEVRVGITIMYCVWRTTGLAQETPLESPCKLLLGALGDPPPGYPE